MKIEEYKKILSWYSTFFVLPGVTGYLLIVFPSQQFFFVKLEGTECACSNLKKKNQTIIYHEPLIMKVSDKYGTKRGKNRKNMAKNFFCCSILGGVALIVYCFVLLPPFHEKLAFFFQVVISDAYCE